MEKISVSIDNQQLVAAKFAKEIKLDDFLKDKTILGQDTDYFKQMFNDVAGEDGIIQGTELEAFLRKVEEASGNDKELNDVEIRHFGETRAHNFGDRLICKVSYEEVFGRF